MRTAIIRTLKRKTNILLLTAGLLAACAPVASGNVVISPTDTKTPGVQATTPSPTESSSDATVTDTPAFEDTDNPSPETTDKPTEETAQSASPTPVKTLDPRFEDIVFRPLLPYDGIRPIYEPHFVTAEEAPLVEDELVMGVEINGEAKAYPVTVLRFREMVDDELGGLPILVTW